MKKKISVFSIISLVISVISVMFWALLFEGMAFAYFPWLITGAISMLFPILAKYLRKRNGKSGIAFEIIALVLGWFSFWYVLPVTIKLTNTFVVFLLCSAICFLYAALFNKTIPSSKKELAISSENEESPKGKRFFFPIPTVLSIIACACSLFLFVDALALDKFEDGNGWIGMFIVYTMPVFLFWINQKKRNFVIAILCSFVTLFLSFAVIQIALLEFAFDFSIEAHIAFFIVFFVSFALFVFSIIDLFKANWKSKSYYNTLRYREKCYKKVARMKAYLDNGIISQEEFEKNKNEILKNIKM